MQTFAKKSHSLWPFVSVFLLSILIAGGSSAACPEGQKKTVTTDGHCCWPGQAWSKDALKCVGLADCPDGLERDDTGESCLKSKCTGGRIQVDGRCCWPGQKWSSTKSRCLGTPKCPRNHVARNGECIPVRVLPNRKTRPYKPVEPKDYILLEPSAYLRGSPRREPGRYRNEKAHTVAMTRKVLLKKTEVTQDEWTQLVAHNPSLFLECGLECPVERINWYEAIEYLNRLSIAEGLTPCYSYTQCDGQLGGGCRVPGEGPRTCMGDFVCTGVNFKGLDCPGYRLPTEAEWEYAARAGTRTATYAGNLSLVPAKDAFVLDAIAWYQRNARVSYASGQSCSVKFSGHEVGADGCGTHTVAQKKPTTWGHFDMLGNVMEWVWDGYSKYPSRSAVDPVEHYGMNRVVRGGSWAMSGKFMRIALRSRLDPKGRNAELGFRVARTVILKPGQKKSKTSKKSKNQKKIVKKPVKVKESVPEQIVPTAPALPPAPSGVRIKVDAGKQGKKKQTKPKKKASANSAKSPKKSRYQIKVSPTLGQ